MELGPEQFFTFDGVPNDPQLLLIAVQPETNIELRARVNSDAFAHHTELTQDIHLESTATDLLLRAWQIDTYQPTSDEARASLKSQLPLFMLHLKSHLNRSWKEMTDHPAYQTNSILKEAAKNQASSGLKENSTNTVNKQNNNSVNGQNNTNTGNGQNNSNAGLGQNNTNTGNGQNNSNSGLGQNNT
ncbi:MAG: hypothetical protein IGS03_16845, partial [Candidatus Sericytochromatia bacterium]|nr:hypothetical protein [Candidatus Sericytochromatia bacterium]